MSVGGGRGGKFGAWRQQNRLGARNKQPYTTREGVGTGRGYDGIKPSYSLSSSSSSRSSSSSSLSYSFSSSSSSSSSSSYCSSSSSSASNAFDIQDVLAPLGGDNDWQDTFVTYGDDNDIQDVMP